jgi:hypothetical protein
MHEPRASRGPSRHRHIGTPDAAEFKLLRPGAKVERAVDLSSSFSLQAPGAYSIRAFYDNAWDGKADGKGAWKGRVSCPQVTLRLDPKTRAKTRA